jgi:hypothetical protein
MAPVAARNRVAALRSAWFFTALSALAMRTAASRARAPMSATRAATSPSGSLATARVLVLLIEGSGLQARAEVNAIFRARPPAYCAARAAHPA